MLLEDACGWNVLFLLTRRIGLVVAFHPPQRGIETCKHTLIPSGVFRLRSVAMVQKRSVSALQTRGIATNSQLTEEHVMLRDMVRSFADSELAPNAGEWDKKFIPRPKSSQRAAGAESQRISRLQGRDQSSDS